MKILKEAEGEPTIIELPPDESALFFEPGGDFRALLAVEDEHGHVNEGAAELAVAIIALGDKTIHDSLRKRLEDESS